MSVTKRFNTTRGGHWYKLDGRKVDGVTTVISNGIPKGALPYWAAKEVAAFAADNLGLLGELDRDERIDLLKGAPWRDRDKAARRGHEVHGDAERLARGEEVDVPDELVGHVDSYLQFRDDWQPRNEILEAVVLNRRHQYMGTLDLICDLTGHPNGLIDLKTNRSGVFSDMGLQLAAYRYAEAYLGPDLTEIPMPAIDWCAVLWLRADGYDLVPVDAGPSTFRSFLYAQQVARFMAREDVIQDALQPPRKAA